SEIGVDGSVDPFYTGVPTFSVRRDYCCEEGPPCGLDPVNMCLIPPKGSPTSRTALRLGSCPMIVTMSTRCVPAVAIWPLAINGVIADTVATLLDHVYPRRVLCNVSVVCSRPSARDSRSMSRAIRPSKHALPRTRYTLFCIFR